MSRVRDPSGPGRCYRLWAPRWQPLGLLATLRRPIGLTWRCSMTAGSTTYNTIKALYAAGKESADKAAVLFRWFLGSAAFTIGKYFVSIPGSVPLPLGPRLSQFGFAVELDPMLVSIGMLVGPYTTAAIAVGTAMSWGVMAPIAQSQGLVSGPAMAMTGARGFILWPGITLLTFGALAQLVFALVDLAKSQTSSQESAETSEAEDHPEQIPGYVLKLGLPLAAMGTILSMKLAFGLPIWQTSISLLLSTVLSYVAVRCVGEININPIGGVGKVGQLLFAALAPGNTVANIMQATVAAAGASQVCVCLGGGGGGGGVDIQVDGV